LKRSRQFVKNTAVGYALIAANIAFTILSVPLALRYLGKEEFGLWALAQQIGGYFLLIDLGITSAMSRFLANHKDEVNGGAYGRLLLTGAIVFAVQGVLLAVFGTIFAFAAPQLFAVPAALAADFRNVLVILSLQSGVAIALRSIAAPLWAFQRLDVSYGFGITSLVGGLAFLWIGFHSGLGVYSFPLAGIPPMILCGFLGLIFCYRRGFYPKSGAWGHPDWAAFKEMLSFGKDVTLMTIGSQLVNASQVIILGRVAGLEAAATFAIGTKFYALGGQLTGRLVESSAPALTEMHVRGENERLKGRFFDICRTSIFLAIAGAVALVMANSMVVGLWTSGVIQWRLSWDILLGLLLLGTTASRCLVSLFGIVGDLRPVRNLYLIEAFAFIALSIPAASRFGISGLLAASIFAHLLITLTFTTYAARRKFA
jgi:O-antigen/teichoic acid export membrane protein